MGDGILNVGVKESCPRLRRYPIRPKRKSRSHAPQQDEKFFDSIGRVEMWRGCCRLDISVFLPFRLAVPYRSGRDPVSAARSSNRTCHGTSRHLGQTYEPEVAATHLQAFAVIEVPELRNF